MTNKSPLNSIPELLEDIQAGNIAKVTFDLIGFGAYDFTAQTAP